MSISDSRRAVRRAVCRQFSAKGPFVFAEMRHSKRTHCPDWDSRESWGHESYSGSHKRKRRSHSSTQENRYCKPHHQFKESDWLKKSSAFYSHGITSPCLCYSEDYGYQHL
uniref:Uncharacterized protein n=1 Tax=Capra hircus TaxID=9925 RepID=A0A8C2QTS8_CAPHI